MATILTSIIEYENTVLSVGHEKVIHTFHPYDFEAYAYNINADYFRRLGRVAQICSYFSFLLSIFLWISMYYDKILFHILINGYQDKSIKIIIGQWRRLFRFILNIFFCFFCPNPFTYKNISPKSLLGRIIIIISCMFGVFLVGLMVVSVTSYLNIVGVESNVYKILLKSNKMEYRNQLAFKAIAQYLKSINEVKKERNMASKDIFLNKVVPTQKKQIHHHLKNFKIADSDFLQTIPSLNEYDNISDHLRFLEENMSKIKKKSSELAHL
jgi:hypothetical protein